jgi:tripartite-type tricarboxylate transporter receptor subunit TctC
MPSTFLRKILFVATIPLGLALTTDAWSQSYPNRAVRLVVPFVAGGAIDVTARRLAEYLSTKSPQQFIVENTVGASGVIGARRVARADPDGYTLLFGTTSVYAINPAINPNVGYDPLKDYALVARAFDSPFMLVVHPSVPVKSLPEFVSWAKANPGKLNYGSSGIGTPQHVIGEMFKLNTGIQMTHVPYKGGAQSVQDVAGGHIQVLFENPLSLIPLVNDGKLTALAVTGETRLDQAKQVPTLIEGGVNFSVTILTGVAAPAGTAQDIVNQLNRWVNDGLRDKDLLESVAKFGATVKPGSPTDFHNFISSEIKRWGDVARAANIKAE